MELLMLCTQPRDCPPERSEGTQNLRTEIFHYVQNDKSVGGVIPNQNPTFGTTAFWALKTHPKRCRLKLLPCLRGQCEATALLATTKALAFQRSVKGPCHEVTEEWECCLRLLPSAKQLLLIACVNKFPPIRLLAVLSAHIKGATMCLHCVRGEK